MQRRSLIRGLAALALGQFVPLVAARAAAVAPRWKSTLLTDHPLVGTIWDAAAGRATTPDALRSALRAARYRLLGEAHDNPDHHVYQLDLLVSLGESGLRPAVALEQLDREFDADLQRALAAGAATAEAAADAGRFDRKNWQWDFYRPLIEAILRYGMPLRAANLSRTGAGQVMKAGLDALGRDRASALRIEAAWSAARERVLRAIIMEGHCGALPESVVPRMTRAQRARDATLAEALLDAGRDGAVLIAGNGHVRRDLAVPLYLREMRPGESVVSVGLLEVEAGATDPREYVAGTAGEEPLYDFIAFTPRWDRPDPCGKFRPQPG